MRTWRVIVCILIGIGITVMTMAAADSSRKTTEEPVEERKMLENLTYDTSITEGLEIAHDFDTYEMVNSEIISYEYLTDSNGKRGEVTVIDIYNHYRYDSEKEVYLKDYAVGDESGGKNIIFYEYDEKKRLIQESTLNPQAHSSCDPCRIYAYSDGDYSVTTMDSTSLATSVAFYKAGLKVSEVKIGPGLESKAEVVKFEYNDRKEVISEQRPTGLADGTSYTSEYEIEHDVNNLLTFTSITYTDSEGNPEYTETRNIEYYPSGAVFRSIRKTLYPNGSFNTLVTCYAYSEPEESNELFMKNKGNAIGVLYVENKTGVPLYGAPGEEIRSVSGESLMTVVFETQRIDDTVWYRITEGEATWVHDSDLSNVELVHFRK